MFVPALFGIDCRNRIPSAVFEGVQQRGKRLTLLIFELMLRYDVTEMIKDVKTTRGSSNVDGSAYEHKLALLRRLARTILHFPTFLLNLQFQLTALFWRTPTSS